jgi:lysophospholipid acyltransferase 1/2
LYLKLFMCLHLTAGLTVFVLPQLIQGSSSDKKSSSTATPKAFEELPKNVKVVAAEDEKKVVTKIRKQSSENGLEPDESSNSSSSCSSYSNSMNDVSDKNHQRKTDTNYLLKDLINKEVNKIKGETGNLSNLLMEKIEAANIEGLIDKAVTGVVELKDDLMRMNEPEVYSGGATDGLRKRNLTENGLEMATSSSKAPDGVDAFLKKEIDAIKEANVIPAVLSNGHAK